MGGYGCPPLNKYVRLTGGGVKSDKCVLLRTSDEHALVSVRLNDHLGTSLHACTTTATENNSKIVKLSDD